MDVSQVLEALRAVHAPNTLDTIRQQANQFLEDFKNTQVPIVVIQTSLSLLSAPDADVRVRHFGLHCFEHVVLNNWNNLAQSDKETVKQQLTQFASSPLTDITSPTNKLIATQLSVVIAEIVKREWPQHWPSFFPLCQQLSSTLNGAHLVLRILALVGEAAFTPSATLPERRRKELQAGVMTHKSELVSLLRVLLESTWQLCEKQPHSAVSRLALGACVSALDAYVDKLSFSLLQEEGILQWLAKLALVPSIAGDVHEVIINLTCRKFTCDLENYDTILTLWHAVVQFAFNILNNSSSVPFDTQIQLLLKTCRAIKVFITTHSSLLNDALNKQGKVGKDAVQNATRRLAQASEIGVGTLQCLCKLLNHESLQVEGEAVGVLIEIFRAYAPSFLRDAALVDVVCNEILARLCIMATKPTFDQHALEFDSEDQFQQSCALLRVQSCAMATQLAILRPVVTVRQLGERLFHYFRKLQATPVVFSRAPSRDTYPPYSPELNQLIQPYVVGSDAALSSDFAQLESVTLLCDHVYRAIDQQVFNNPLHQQGVPDDVQAMKEEISKLTQELLRLTLAFTHPDVALWTPRIRVLAAFLPVYRHSSEAVQMLLEACFQMVLFNPNNCMGLPSPQTATTDGQKPADSIAGAAAAAGTGAGTGQKPEPIVDVRRRACYTLLTLGKRVPHAFKPFFLTLHKQICTLAEQEQVTPGEHVYLLELLLILTLETGSADEQVRFIEELASPHVQFWTGNTVQSVLSSLSSFAPVAGLSNEEQQYLQSQLQQWTIYETQGKSHSLTQTPTFIPNPTPYQDLRYKIFFTLNTLCSLIRTLATYTQRATNTQAIRVMSLSPESKALLMKQAQTDEQTAAMLPTMTEEKPGGFNLQPHPALTALVPLLLPRLLSYLQLSAQLMEDDVLKTVPPRMHALAAPTFPHMLWQLLQDGPAPITSTPGLSASNTLPVSSALTAPPRTHHVVRDSATWMEQCLDLTLQLILGLSAAGRPFSECLLTHKQVLESCFQSLTRAPPHVVTMTLVRFVGPALLRCSPELYPAFTTITSRFTATVATQSLQHIWYARKLVSNTTYGQLAKAIGTTYASKLFRLRGGTTRLGVPPLCESLTHHVQDGLCTCSVVETMLVSPPQMLQSLASHDLSRLCPHANASITAILNGNIPPTRMQAAAAASKTLPLYEGEADRELDILEDREARELARAVAAVWRGVCGGVGHEQKVFEKANRNALITVGVVSGKAEGGALSEDMSYFGEYLCRDQQARECLMLCASKALHCPDQQAIIEASRFLRSLVNLFIANINKLQTRAKQIQQGAVPDVSTNMSFFTGISVEEMSVCASTIADAVTQIVSISIETLAFYLCDQTTTESVAGMGIVAGAAVGSGVSLGGVQFRLEESCIDELSFIIRDALIQCAAVPCNAATKAMINIIGATPAVEAAVAIAMSEGEGRKQRQMWREQLIALMKGPKSGQSSGAKSNVIVDLEDRFDAPEKKGAKPSVNILPSLSKLFGDDNK